MLVGVPAGGLDNRLTEGDVIAVFSQYGEPVDINLARDKVRDHRWCWSGCGWVGGWGWVETIATTVY
jgi:hypothetical protein